MRSSTKLILCGCLAAAFTATATAQPTNIAVSPSSGTGTAQSFAFQASSPNGAADLSQITAMFNYAIDGYGSCFVVSYPALNSISLMDDAGNWPAFQTLGTSGSMQNSQCLLNVAASSLQTSLNTVTLNLALTFKPGLPGRQNVYMESWNAAGLTSGWQQMGTWDTNTATVIYQPPVLLDVQPASGTGLAQTFTFRATSVNGYQYLTQLHAIFDITPATVARCWIYYNRLQNYVYLMNDTQTDWFTAHLGDGGVISNSQCSVNASASSVGATGANELDVHVAVVFNPAWVGLKGANLYVEDRAAATAGFTQMGTWTVGTAATPPANVSVSPSSGTGTTQTFAFQASSPNGAADLNQITAMFNYTIDGYGSCFVVSYPALNSISLMDDSGNWSPFQTLGTPGNLQNSQCTLNVAASSLQISFNTVTLNLALTFKPGLPGRQNVYMQSWNAAGLTSGWQQMGTWDTNTATIIYQPPTLLDVQPASGTGLAQTFTFRATSVNGYQYLTQLHTIFDITPAAVARCWIYYNRLQNYVYLMNDTQTDWFAAHMGDGGVISNSQCSVNASASSVSATGANELDLHLALTFNPAWAGLKGANLYVEDRAAATAGFTQMGTWTVGALVPITFQSSPSGRSIQVDGAAYTTPVTLQLVSGSHTLDASVSQNPPAGNRYNFLSWSDGGAAAHTVTTSSAATYTANFTTQYAVATSVGPSAAGSVTLTPPGGWYPAGTQVTAGAAVNPGWAFTGFTGSINSPVAPQAFTVNAPVTLTANFTPDFSLAIPTPVTALINGSVQFTVTVTGQNGFNDSVTFDAPTLPTGATATFTPPTVYGSGASPSPSTPLLPAALSPTPFAALPPADSPTAPPATSPSRTSPSPRSLPRCPPVWATPCNTSSPSVPWPASTAPSASCPPPSTSIPIPHPMAAATCHAVSPITASNPASAPSLSSSPSPLAASGPSTSLSCSPPAASRTAPPCSFLVSARESSASPLPRRRRRKVRSSRSPSTSRAISAGST
jgi:hypothetical protein